MLNTGRNTRFILCATALLVSASAFGQAKDGKGKAPAAPAPMSFFVTSAGSGKGADLGGLAGADQLCQMRAAAVGRGSSTCGGTSPFGPFSLPSTQPMCGYSMPPVNRRPVCIIWCPVSCTAAAV